MARLCQHCNYSIDPKIKHTTDVCYRGRQNVETIKRMGELKLKNYRKISSESVRGLPYDWIYNIGMFYTDINDYNTGNNMYMTNKSEEDLIIYSGFIEYKDNLIKRGNSLKFTDEEKSMFKQLYFRSHVKLLK